MLKIDFGMTAAFLKRKGATIGGDGFSFRVVMI